MEAPPARPLSLRDYLYRKFCSDNKLADISFVLAESASELYRDSGYMDLIEFESDIAQLSDLVLLVTESPGSLTELGAFAMHEHISPRLHVLIQQRFYTAESFVRNGPVRHMENLQQRSIFYYPWKTHRNGHLNFSTISGEYPDVRNDLTSNLSQRDSSERFDPTNSRHTMIASYWCLYILRGATISELLECLTFFGITMAYDKLRRHLYSMRVAGWIGETQYGHKRFYYVRVDNDPFLYAFSSPTSTNDSLRWKSDIALRMKSRSIARPRPIIRLSGT